MTPEQFNKAWKEFTRGNRIFTPDEQQKVNAAKQRRKAAFKPVNIATQEPSIFNSVKNYSKNILNHPITKNVKTGLGPLGLALDTAYEGKSLYDDLQVLPDDRKWDRAGETVLNLGTTLGGYKVGGTLGGIVGSQLPSTFETFTGRTFPSTEGDDIRLKQRYNEIINSPNFGIQTANNLSNKEMVAKVQDQFEINPFISNDLQELNKNKIYNPNQFISKGLDNLNNINQYTIDKPREVKNTFTSQPLLPIELQGQDTGIKLGSLSNAERNSAHLANLSAYKYNNNGKTIYTDKASMSPTDTILTGPVDAQGNPRSKEWIAKQAQALNNLGKIEVDGKLMSQDEIQQQKVLNQLEADRLPIRTVNPGLQDKYYYSNPKSNMSNKDLYNLTNYKWV